MGLLLLREGPGIDAARHRRLARDADATAPGSCPTLERYTQVERQRVVPGETVALGERLSYRAFDVPTVKKARFGGGVEDEGRVVGYRLTDTATGRVAVYLPGVQEVTPAVHEELAGADVVLVDGTTWTDDEMIRLGLASKTARDMGHLAVAGPGGSLDGPRPACRPSAGSTCTSTTRTRCCWRTPPSTPLVEDRGVEIGGRRARGGGLRSAMTSTVSGTRRTNGTGAGTAVGPEALVERLRSQANAVPQRARLPRPHERGRALARRRSGAGWRTASATRRRSPARTRRSWATAPTARSGSAGSAASSTTTAP